MSDPIRLATEADVAALVRLNSEVQALHADLAPDQFYPVAPHAAVAAFFAKLIAKDGNEVGLYPAAGEPLGYIWIEFQSGEENAFKKPWHRVYVHHLSVTETARGQGVATTLMGWAEQRARELGVPILALDHLAGNTGADAFYAKLGFETARVTRAKKIDRAG
jgi:diamine N-acetyltransferase